jgi:hypothetical protein
MIANSLKQDQNGSSDTASARVGGNQPNPAGADANSTPLKKVVGALDEHECAPHETPNGSWMSLCPAHDDNNPSLSITEVTDGKVLLCCHAGCETEAIVQALGLTMSDLFTPKKGHSIGGIIKTYDYHDESGTFLFQVCRYEPKSFRQRCPNGAGGWTWSIKGIRRVIYRLPAVIAAVKRGERIYICEGEKDVEAMVTHGFVATCNSGGAGKLRVSIAIQVADERERVRFVQWAARGDHFPASLLEQIMMRARRVLKRSRRGQIFISSV